MVSVAELEAGMVGERTRKALAAAKANGKVLGGRPLNSATIHLTGAPASRALRIAKADKRAIDLAPILAEVWETGAMSLRQIAGALNERRIPTARGGQWSAVQVQRAMARLPT